MQEAKIEETDTGRMPAGDGLVHPERQGLLVLCGECLVIVEAREADAKMPPNTRAPAPWP